MTDPDLIRALSPILRVFEETEIPYYISGSLASSVYGIARATIDVFIQADEPYPRTAMERRRADTLSEEQMSREVFFCSTEDIILHKLQWYESGGRASERQWLDVLGVVKVQGDSLNKEYLKHWSGEIGVFELLRKAFREGGVAL